MTVPNLSHGRMLLVDLSDGTLEERELDDDLFKRKIGGAPLIANMAKKDGISIGCGPLTGTPCPGASMAMASIEKDRMHRFAPIMLDAGLEFKLSGFDIIVIEGRSEKPVYLWIRDQVADLVSAERFEEKDCWGVISAIRKEQGDQRIQVVSCSKGPSASASFVSGWDGIGFGGAMRDMNLRAVAVRGMSEATIEDPLAFLAKSSEMMRSAARSIGDRSGIASLLPNEASARLKGTGRNRACFSCPYPCMSYADSGDAGHPQFLLMDQKSISSMSKTSGSDIDLVRKLASMHRVGEISWGSDSSATYETMTDGVGEYDLIAAGYVLGICPRFLGLIQAPLSSYIELLGIGLGGAVSKESVLSLGNCLLSEACK